MSPREAGRREHVDGPDADPAVVEDTLRTLERFNAGPLRTHALLAERLRRLLAAGRPVEVLDWGCGGGDGARALVAEGRRRGVPVRVHGVDLSPVAVALAREEAVPGTTFERADALEGGADPGEFDLVVSNFLLHHLPDDGAVETLLRRGARARAGFLHLDGVRSRAAWLLFAALGRPLCRRRETWEDGLTSIRRSFTGAEAAALAARAAPGSRVEVRWPFRLLVSGPGGR